jgi:hypothetical protein
MTQQASNEFVAAKVIVEALKGLDPQQQDRAIRFASESVGLQTHAVTSVSAPAPNPGTPAVEGAQAMPLTRIVDIKQFVDSKSPKSDQQFATVVAYFYRFVAPTEQQKESINAEDLKNAARLVGRKQPGNALATLNNAKNSGYVDSLGKGLFQINPVGENLVAITLPDTGTEQASPRGNAKRKKKSKKSAPKKSAPKKSAPKKSAPKKSAPKKSAPKKSASKKHVAKGHE